jgi:hypothetical protein
MGFGRLRHSANGQFRPAAASPDSQHPPFRLRLADIPEALDHPTVGEGHALRPPPTIVRGPEHPSEGHSKANFGRESRAQCCCADPHTRARRSLINRDASENRPCCGATLGILPGHVAMREPSVYMQHSGYVVSRAESAATSAIVEHQSRPFDTRTRGGAT